MKMLVQARSELLRMRRPCEEERDELFQVGCAASYGPFASLRELEAILRIYIKMFRLIEHAADIHLSADDGNAQYGP